MLKNLLLVIATASAITGCASRNTHLVDTKTIHDATASRIWIIQDVNGEDQHVVLCDITMFQQAGTLCMRASIAQAPPMQAPMPGHFGPPAPSGR